MPNAGTVNEKCALQWLIAIMLRLYEKEHDRLPSQEDDNASCSSYHSPNTTGKASLHKLF